MTSEVGRFTGVQSTAVMWRRICIVVALEVLGRHTSVSELTPERLAAFYACDRVTRTRTGKPKARVSVEKTRRAVRQAVEAIMRSLEIPKEAGHDAKSARSSEARSWGVQK